MPKSQHSWVQSQHPATLVGIWAAADEEVSNKVHIKKPTKNPPLLQEQLNASTRCPSASKEIVQEVETNVKVKHQRNLQMFNLALCKSTCICYPPEEEEERRPLCEPRCFSLQADVRLHSCKNPCWHTPLYCVHALWKQHTRNLNFRFWKYANCRGGEIGIPRYDLLGVDMDASRPWCLCVWGWGWDIWQRRESFLFKETS